MDDVAKYLRRMNGPTPWDRWLLDPDKRPAAEVMAAVVRPLMGRRPLGEVLQVYSRIIFEENGWRTYDWSLAGPRASQIFDATVLREQVDPV